MRQRNLLFWQVHDTETIPDIGIILFLPYRSPHQIFCHAVLKITSVKWRRYCLCTDWVDFAPLSEAYPPVFRRWRSECLPSGELGFVVDRCKRWTSNNPIGRSRIEPNLESAPAKGDRWNILLKPHIPNVHFFQMWKEKFFDHLPVSSCIHRDSALVLLKKIRTNDPERWNCAPNGNTLTMKRGFGKLTWIFSTPVAHVLFVDTAGKVKGEMERPLLKYTSTANARCSLVQRMIETGCGGTKIEDLPSRTHPLPAPYLHPLPFGGFFKKVSFSAVPCID